MIPVVILAGGLATRLRPLTDTMPKSMLPVNGEPFISHQLRLLAGQGVSDLVLCTGFLGELIENFVRDGASFGLRVRYSHDGEKPLGTAGAIRKALPLLRDSFFVLYGDSYLTCNFAEVERVYFAANKPGLMTVYANQGLFDRSNVEFSDRQIRVYDKRNATPNMRHIDYGLGVFHPSVFQHYPENVPLDLERVYQDLLASNGLAAVEVSERFYEIGSFSGLRELGELIAVPVRS
jgi:NDP-sugar pyrophosphorylase family protein